jgi:hypothetical protein
MKYVIATLTPGQQALVEVAHMLTYSRKCREGLRKAGWQRVLKPPLINNQWVWEHPLYGIKLQEEAMKCISL